MEILTFLSPIIPLFILITVILFGFIYALDTVYNPLKEAMAQLGGKINYKGEAVFSLQGREICVKYYRGSRHSMPYIRMYVPGNFAGRLHIRYENSMDRFFKSIGLNRELQVSDRTTNSKLYFEGENQEFLKRLFTNPAAKEKVFELVTNSSSITITPSRCQVRMVCASKFTPMEKDLMVMAAKQLVSLAALIPSTTDSHPDQAIFMIKRLCLYMSGSIALVVGIFSLGKGIMFYPIVDYGHLWIMSFACSVVIIVGVGAVVFLFIRGYSTSSKVFIYFLCTFSIGIILCARYGTAVMNGAQDISPVKQFDQVVMRKYMTTHKRSTTYHVDIKPWRSNRSAWSFTVNSNEYNSINPNQTVYRISTRQGAYGWEWITATIRLEDQPLISLDSWPDKNYKGWYPLPVNEPNIDYQEMQYWKAWVMIIEEGITNRMNMHDVMNANYKAGSYSSLFSKYQQLQEDVLYKLSQLEVPERLKPFHAFVMKAGPDQISFYSQYAQIKESNLATSFNDVSENNYLKVSDKALWDAYHDFQALYPSRSQAFNDSIEKRLCWFDII